MSVTSGPGRLSRWLTRRAYRAQLHEARHQVGQQLALIGHPEYPRVLTAEGLVKRLDAVLALNRQLAAHGYLTQAAADEDATMLLGLRRSAVDASRGP